MGDIIALLQLKDKIVPTELGLMIRSEDSDPNEYFSRVSAKVERILNCC